MVLKYSEHAKKMPYIALSTPIEGETFLFVDWTETIMIKLPVQINVPV